MAKKHTIYDVARIANVAISTVSRVLNGSPYVSNDTKERVQKAIDQLDFRPQVNARKLARQEAQIIAVALPTFTTPFFNEVLKGVKDKIKDTDLDFIIYNTGSDNPEETLKTFLDRGIPDALIIFSINLDEDTRKRLLNAGIPVVLVGFKHEDFNYLYWNNYKGGYLAGEHLIKEGYQKIGMVRSHSKSPVADSRENGFRDVLVKYNLPLDENFFVKGITKKHSGYSEEAGYESVQIMRERGGLPEAIFCTNDAQAIGVIHALDELNLRIPDDIAVMGYDNIKTAQYLGLSTIDQQMYEVGTEAISRITKMIKDKDRSLVQKEIEPKLIVRKSTRKP
ncbi:LacI family DNA-binding transcriptional regulator [Natronogracilivirga saccharolytica]|uniref:LacI family DNA-binding transcriptional regulator n=1 Tax=Natronogracilivirga saccharolytica TaxID=2812953 RepID=A0A8J7UX49_9BACT|nr:LacI family DNA-binding transcriptional regulator [Natronogracilivirga saccharolytica]MBP3192924.1 LacI family DNA-binding transcriptional regulator [Natronogracilivirga saccharolytica]